MYLPEYNEYFPFLRRVLTRTGEFTTSSSPFDNETLTASRAAVYLKENVSPDELSADDRLQMATLLLAGEYGVELEYDSDGRVVGVTFSGIPLSSDHLQLLSMLPQLSSVSMNYSREDDSLVETSDLSEPGMDLTGVDLPGMPVLAGEGKSEEVTAFQQSDLARLVRISGLKDLHLDGDLFTDDVIEQIVKIKGLHSLHLSTSQITGASLRQLEQLSDLREISFFGCEKLTDENLLAIAAMPNMRSVSISDCKRTSSKGLAGILALPVLETLALYDSAENLDEQALEKLSTSHLNSVILVGELDDSICTRLATISSLEEIAIVSTVFRGEQLEQLKSLERLVNLKLEGCTSLTVEGLRQINQLTGLRKLSLNHSEVSDEEVLQLTDLKQLEFLDLRVNQSLTDTGLAALAAMPKLQELSLFYCPGIRGEGLDHLDMLSELRILDIGNNKIRDVGLQRLSNNRSIWELKLSLNPEFTDAGAIYLGRMKQLKKLELGFTTQLSLDLILKLDAALPGCEITPSQR
jgi:Leucine-rich repeat (LRR) protein